MTVFNLLFLQNWPEATDPHKFVYEDIAIATYLLVRWRSVIVGCVSVCVTVWAYPYQRLPHRSCGRKRGRHERCARGSHSLILVVAMGCWSIFSHVKGYVLHCMGGGILISRLLPHAHWDRYEAMGEACLWFSVSVLQHPGRGIDLRERKIWQLFKPKAHLEVCAEVTTNQNIVAIETSKLWCSQCMWQFTGLYVSTGVHFDPFFWHPLPWIWLANWKPLRWADAMDTCDGSKVLYVYVRNVTSSCLLHSW